MAQVLKSECVSVLLSGSVIQLCCRTKPRTEFRRFVPARRYQTWNWVTFCDPVTRESSDPETPLTRWPCSIMNSKCRLMLQTNTCNGQEVCQFLSLFGVCTLLESKILKIRFFLLERESVKPLQFYWNVLPISYFIDQRRLSFWHKIQNSNNTVLRTLSSLKHHSFVAIAAKCGISSHNVSLKKAVWQTFSSAVLAKC